MINKIKNKKIIIILILFLISAVSLISLAIQTKKPPSPVADNQKNPPQIILLNKYPSMLKQPMVSARIAASFTFNLPISLSEISVLITPSAEKQLSLSKDKKILYIQPVSAWRYGTEYQIIVQGLLIETKTTFTPIKPTEVEEVFDETPR